MNDSDKKSIPSRHHRQQAVQPDGGRSVERTERRRLVRALATGGVVAGVALPEKWSAPVVDSVLLPAHAQATTSGFFGQGDLNNFIVGLPAGFHHALGQLARSVNLPSRERVGLFDNWIGTAHAGEQPSMPEVYEASSSSFGFVIGYLSPDSTLTLRMDMRFFAGSENPFDITCTQDAIIPLCLEGKINENDFKPLNLINCEGFSPLSGYIHARIKSIASDSALIELQPESNGVTDTLYLMRGGDRPNCPNCQSAVSGLEGNCTSPWSDDAD